MAERHRVVLFLTLMKSLARQRFVFVGRQENIATLASLGITRQHAQSLVMGLKPEDYVSGPDPDHNNPGLELWVFGIRVESSEIYVKLQLLLQKDKCVCVSFHTAKFTMHYPLREGGVAGAGEGS